MKYMKYMYVYQNSMNYFDVASRRTLANYQITLGSVQCIMPSHTSTSEQTSLVACAPANSQ